MIHALVVAAWVFFLIFGGFTVVMILVVLGSWFARLPRKRFR